MAEAGAGSKRAIPATFGSNLLIGGSGIATAAIEPELRGLLPTIVGRVFRIRPALP